MLPAVAQGAVGVTCRAIDARARALLAALDHAPSRIEITAERAMLATLDGSCRTPIAALARADGTRLTLKGLIAKPDGSRVVRGAREGNVAGAREGTTTDAEALGRALGQALRAEAGPNFLPGF